MFLFIVTEVMFFFSFFWAFFHSSIAPSVEIGCTWPPYGIKTFDTMGLPFLNTLILLTSGFSVTWAHHALIHQKFEQTRVALILTILFALMFTDLQVNEYLEAEFSISDGIYGSVFFFYDHRISWISRNNRNNFFNYLLFQILFMSFFFKKTFRILVFISIYWWGNTQVVLF